MLIYMTGSNLNYPHSRNLKWELRGKNSIVVAWTSIIDTATRIWASRLKSLISSTPKKSGSLSVSIKVICRIASLHFSTTSCSIHSAVTMRVSGCHATAGVRISYGLLVLLVSCMWFPLKKFSSATGMPSTDCCQFFFILSIDCIYFLKTTNTWTFVRSSMELRDVALENT